MLSTPAANPETMVKPSSQSIRVSFSVRFSPSADGLRVPTTATQRVLTKSQYPLVIEQFDRVDCISKLLGVFCRAVQANPVAFDAAPFGTKSPHAVRTREECARSSSCPD